MNEPPKFLYQCVPQADCLSPILFTLYLAHALESETPGFEDPLRDHTYSKVVDSLLISQQYADTGWIGVNARDETDKIKEEVPEKLKKSNLTVNEGKTEEYHITRGGEESWKVFIAISTYN